MNGPWLVETLRRLARAPGMWLRRQDARSLQTYLLGYEQARVDLQQPAYASQAEAELLPGFYRWLENKYSVKDNRGWDYIVDDLCENKSDGASRFFTELDEYMSGDLLRSADAE